MNFSRHTSNRIEVAREQSEAKPCETQSRQPAKVAFAPTDILDLAKSLWCEGEFLLWRIYQNHSGDFCGIGGGEPSYDVAAIGMADEDEGPGNTRGGEQRMQVRRSIIDTAGAGDRVAPAKARAVVNANVGEFRYPTSMTTVGPETDPAQSKCNLRPPMSMSCPGA